MQVAAEALSRRPWQTWSRPPSRSWASCFSLLDPTLVSVLVDRGQLMAWTSNTFLHLNL